MKKIIPAGLFVVLYFTISSAVVFADTESRDIDNFDKIEISVPCKLIIHQSDNTTLRLEGSEESIDAITTKVQSGTLNISVKKNCNVSLDAVIYISTPHLKEIEAAGRTDIEFENKFNEQRFELESAGKSKLKGKQFFVDEMSIEVAGSSSVEIAGTCDNLHIEIAGSCTIDAEGFKAKNAVVEMAGSSNVNIHVTETLRTEIVGGGEINYKGNPVVSANTVGSGKTTKVD